MAIDLSPRINPLYSFETIFDTDFGLLRLIRDEYRAESTFDLSVLDLSNDELIEVLMNRDTLNPLSVCMLNYDEKEAMDLYMQFREREEAAILERSKFTGIGDLFVSSPVVLSDIVPTVSFRTEYQKEFLRDVLKNSNIDIQYDEVMMKGLDCEKYDPIVIKDCTEFLEYKNYFGSNIYLPRYKFNVINKDGKEYIEPSIALTLLDQCSVSIINLYSNKNGKEEDNE